MSINGLAPGTILRGEKYEYEIRKVLGSGSFGITYVAMMKGDDGSLPVAVAIKEFFMREINGRDGSTVSNSSANNVFGYYKKKFIKEALSLGRLNHPGIIKVIESFEANNTCYYSMEYIRGGSLDDLIERKGSLGEQETVALAGKIGEALEYMHFKNMVHLDLKPGNIMMRDDRTPVLIDFGLSKKFDADGHAETSTTLGCGTPGYAPIEQATQQKTDELPVTMDIYAFGATLFKMLTGQRPNDASTLMNDGFPKEELRKKGVSVKLTSAIEKAMSPAKRNRPQNVNGFLESMTKKPDVKIPKDEPTVINKTGSHQTSKATSKKFSTEDIRINLMEKWSLRSYESNRAILVTFIAIILVIIIGACNDQHGYGTDHSGENLFMFGIISVILQVCLIDNRKWAWYLSLAVGVFYCLFNFNNWDGNGICGVALLPIVCYFWEMFEFLRNGDWKTFN